MFGDALGPQKTQQKFQKSLQKTFLTRFGANFAFSTKFIVFFDEFHTVFSNFKWIFRKIFWTISPHNSPHNPALQCPHSPNKLPKHKLPNKSYSKNPSQKKGGRAFYPRSGSIRPAPVAERRSNLSSSRPVPSAKLFGRRDLLRGTVL